MAPSPQARNTGNLLIDRIPAEEFRRFEPHLKIVNLSARTIIHQFGSKIEHVYFPTTGLTSLLTVLEEDDPVEAATVGKEGMIGVSASLGVDLSPHRAICQMSGAALQLSTERFLEAVEQSPAMNVLIRRYLAFSLRNAAQMLACNALHTVEARASKWLLMIHDQVEHHSFSMTHEFLAYMLGVRRQSVTVVAGSLQNAGLITYRRGVIEVVDRPGLEMAACECYQAIRNYYREALG